MGSTIDLKRLLNTEYPPLLGINNMNIKFGCLPKYILVSPDREEVGTGTVVSFTLTSLSVILDW